MTHEELLVFGERVRRQRNAIGMTQEQVSDQVGITLRFYQMLERGEKKPSLETLIQLSQVLRISMDYLVFGTPSSSSDDPITEIFSRLSPRQKNDAASILQLYSRACDGTPS